MVVTPALAVVKVTGLLDGVNEAVVMDPGVLSAS